MKHIFKDIKIIVENGKSDMKDITWWTWHFTYRGELYTGSIHNAMYEYGTVSPIPTYIKIEITPIRQIDLLEGMINMMKGLIAV